MCTGITIRDWCYNKLVKVSFNASVYYHFVSFAFMMTWRFKTVLTSVSNCVCAFCCVHCIVHQLNRPPWLALLLHIQGTGFSVFFVACLISCVGH
jgi:hypothetical protein